MANYRWSETFLSIEGEAKYSGKPTAYVRFFGCNFECRGFNNPNNVDPSSPEVLGFDPKRIPTVDAIPVPIEVGCDSIYSWHKDFRHMTKTGNEDVVAQEIIELIPGQEWINEKTKGEYMLSLTGGEPTLHQKILPTLLEHSLIKPCKHFLIETNCSIPLRKEFIQYLRNEEQYRIDNNVQWTWSNSPKLPVSGEPWEKAIRPDIAIQQLEVGANVDQYFKFVCDATNKSFDEVCLAMEQYWNAGVPRSGSNIYIMPVACTEEQQDEIAEPVADKCLEYGFVYCHRIHNTVYKNAIGK